MKDYRVQFANSWSEKNGDEVTDETMSLEEARRWISNHPQTEYVILERESDAPGSVWSLLES
ncbi:hypothetical protein [Microbacterium sp. RURRCA19A]|uniref:hypothetical protein n=1 Tax=Microbacterium sp. RURRCA19A TaxID=1907391 RepID=UPI0011154BC2|nr:hypothetical protein [Microbacterium sp. RURRCA19A]